MRTLIVFLGLQLSAIVAFAGDWKKVYSQDEFGDTDYSSPGYVLHYAPEDDQFVEITYYKGIICLDLWYYEDVHHVQSIRAKSNITGKIYDFAFKSKNDFSPLHMISDPTDVRDFVDLLEQGNFALSIKHRTNMHGDIATRVYKFGSQGQGIKRLIGATTSTNKLTFKGKIGGKYSITVQFDQTESVFEYGGNLTGTYWYGTGKNGKMTLKGTIDSLGRIEMVEYDPQGKKCGDWYVNTLSSDDGIKYALYGVMINAKGQTFSVDCDQQ